MKSLLAVAGLTLALAAHAGDLFLEGAIGQEDGYNTRHLVLGAGVDVGHGIGLEAGYIMERGPLEHRQNADGGGASYTGSGTNGDSTTDVARSFHGLRLAATWHTPIGQGFDFVGSAGRDWLRSRDEGPNEARYFAAAGVGYSAFRFMLEKAGERSPMFALRVSHSF